jgi:hypothetical protein
MRSKASKLPCNRAVRTSDRGEFARYRVPNEWKLVELLLEEPISPDMSASVD